MINIKGNFPTFTIYYPKTIAKITIAGLTFCISEDNKNFIKPTKRQIKHLKKTFGIEVKLLEDNWR